MRHRLYRRQEKLRLSPQRLLQQLLHVPDLLLLVELLFSSDLKILGHAHNIILPLEYWGDSASSSPAEGGGIIRIGYDQAKFEQAIKDVLTEPQNLNSKPEEEGEESQMEDAPKEVAKVVKVEIRKEDVSLLVRITCFRMPSATDLRLILGLNSGVRWRLPTKRQRLSFVEPGETYSKLCWS